MSGFFWVRTWDPYQGWGTYYEGWEEPLARSYSGRIQAGSYVIADIFDLQSNSWHRETWQSYTPQTEPGKPRDIEGAAPVDPPTPAFNPSAPVSAAPALIAAALFVGVLLMKGKR